MDGNKELAPGLFLIKDKVDGSGERKLIVESHIQVVKFQDSGLYLDTKRGYVTIWE